MTAPPPESSPAKATNWFKYLVWAVVIGFVAFLGIGLFQQQAPPPIPGNQAPDIPLTFYSDYEWDGRETANLSDLRGEIVVLNFWASWCVPCQQEAEFLQNISEEYADRGVVFIGLAWTDTDRASREFLTQYGITYPNAPDLELNGGDTYRITGVPETYIIDRDGTIRFFHASVLTENDLRAMLNEILEG